MKRIWNKNIKFKFALVITIFGLIGLVSGTSYAILKGNVSSEYEQIIKVGSVLLQLTENYENFNNDITILSDSEGLLLENSYEFNIRNIGDVAATFDLKLVNEVPSDYTGNILDDSYVKIGIEINGEEYGPFNLEEVNNVIDSNIINKNEIINYKLRIWLDEEKQDELVNMEDYKSFFNIEVEAKQSEYSALTLDTSGANKPVLSDNMIAVYYDEESEVWKKADSKNKNEEYKWYNYDEKMWANSVTVSETNRETYLNADTGTEIPMDDILTMQVWIPRYKYTVWNYNSDGEQTSEPQEINIEWEKETTTGEIACTDLENMGTSTGTSSGTEPTTSETCVIKATNAECTNDTCNNKTYTHPAFTFGDDELTGFWVGKFEVSSDTNCSPASRSAIGEGCNLTTIKPLVKPDVTSWRGAMVGTFENNIMTMNDSSNIYGFETTDDTHMIKNMEWGAVAYLAHSKYGTCTDGECTEININNSNGNYTGRSGGNVGGSTPINGTYTDQTSTTKYNTYGYYTYDGYLLEYGTNTKSETRDLSKVASTTGNIYGIYDMSGGTYEYVMGNIVSPDGETMMSGYRANTSYPNDHSGYSGILYYDDTTSAGYGTYTGTYEYPDNKYYDKYSFNTSSSTGGKSKLGDGIKEVLNSSTRGWYSDYPYLALSDYPWLSRGGDCFDGSGAGVFNSYGYNYGFADGISSSRLVISQTN